MPLPSSSRQSLEPTPSIDIEQSYIRKFFSFNKNQSDDDTTVLNSQSLNKRPSAVRWKQQQLAAWQPILRPSNVIFTFFLFSAILLAVSVILFLANNQVYEVNIDYTECRSILDPNEPCWKRWEFGWQSCQCQLQFDLEHDIPGPVFLYYGLDGFYQNHRRYVRSVDNLQLLGQDRTMQQLSHSCAPYDQSNGKPIAPCGAIANSMFTDRFGLSFHDQIQNEWRQISIEETEISWPFDRYKLFKNPPGGFDRYEKPINWTIRPDQLDVNDPENNGYQNEHFMIWMRVAAFSNFRKLWGRIDPGSLPGKPHGLPRGHYQLQVDYEFRTLIDNLRIGKRMILSNMSWMGGRNPFLAWLYLFTGITCLLVASIFSIRILFKRRQNQRRLLQENNNNNKRRNYQATNERNECTRL